MTFYHVLERIPAHDPHYPDAHHAWAWLELYNTNLYSGRWEAKNATEAKALARSRYSVPDTVPMVAIPQHRFHSDRPRQYDPR